MGRGAHAFDPYQSAASGALRLDLVAFNGCEVLPSGNAVSRGTANIPYPDQCPSMNAYDPNDPTAIAPPTAARTVVSGTTYFLNQLSITDTVVNQFTNGADLSPALRWISTQSRFKDLDWTNLGVALDSWTPYNGSWIREVSFGNAAWMTAGSDTFLLEILDKAGQVRESATYKRTDFLGDSPTAGHSRVSWRMESVLPPTFPGDITPHPLPDGTPVTYRTVVRLDLVGSTNPFNSFRMPDLQGDGAIRVTWSLMPNAPFYFPVKFTSASDTAATCLTPDGTRQVPCTFGLSPEAKLSAPQNGQFYQPGDSFDVYVALKDGNGNLLHQPDSLPSYEDFFADNSNGLLYYNPGAFNTLMEYDSESGYQVVGPLQNLRTQYDPNQLPPYYSYSVGHSYDMAAPIASQGIVPGLFQARWPTRVPVTLPPDAQPGTYAVLVKANREFMGERISKTTATFFQVGQTAATSYPGRIGNCQICHRGVLSLDNLRHGLSVDHVEACKSCHANNMSREVHQIHVQSTKYPLAKNDCTICHLTRESATRPSIDVCSSCHPSVHGDQFFQVEFATTWAPNRYGNCAQSCHVDTTPKNHILPAN